MWLEAQEEEEGGRREEGNCERKGMEEDVEIWECKKLSSFVQATEFHLRRRVHDIPDYAGLLVRGLLKYSVPSIEVI
jgi:hypothetical protein